MSKGAPNLALCLALFGATWFLYTPSLHHDFVPLDDDIYVTDNPHLAQGLGAGASGWFFRPYESNFIPLTWFSFALDYQLGGLDPRTYHRTNVLLHAANSALLFLALGALTRSRWRSALAAALFAVHPLHVESVAWVAERKDVLSGLFAMLTLWCYAAYARRAGSRSTAAPYLGVCVFTALGLAAKPMLVTLPFVLLLLDVWPLRRMAAADDTVAWSPPRIRRAALEKLPLLCLAAVASALTFWAQSSAGTVADIEEVGFSLLAWNALLSPSTYLGQTAWPTNLAVFYPHPADQVSIPWALASASGLAAVSAFVFWQLRARPQLFVGWFWFLGMLLPVIGLVQVGMQAHADRYMYLPQIGLWIALLWSVPTPRRHASRAGLALATAGVLALLAAQSHRQLEHWRDGVALFEHAVSVTEPSATSQQSLGLAYMQAGRSDEALEAFRTAARLRPDWSRPHGAAGRVLADGGDYTAAHAAYARAVTLEPESVILRLGFARVLLDAEQPDGALPHLVQALRLDDGTHGAEIHAHLGLAYQGVGRQDLAIRHFRRAIELRPDAAPVHGHLALALQTRGDTAEALESYRRAVQLDANLAGAHGNIAVLLHGEGRDEEALAHLRRAQALGADDAALHFAAYQILVALGDERGAVDALRATLERRKNWLEPLNNLAWHLVTSQDASVRDPKEGLRLARQAAHQTQYENFAILDTLAAAWVANGEVDRARKILDTAIGQARQQGDTTLVRELEKHHDQLALPAP